LVSHAEGRRLRVSENRVPRTVGLKREEVAGSWRRLHNEELHNFYSLPNIVVFVFKSRRTREANHVARMGR
jgi:hypothetical protein